MSRVEIRKKFDGIVALADWPTISFIDDRDGTQFKVIVFRSHDPELIDLTHKKLLSGLSDPKAEILSLLRNDPDASYELMAKKMKVSASTIKRLLQELKRDGVIMRDGARRGGTWKVIS